MVNGTMERWVEHMTPHRGRMKFRFILAAGFAAPLLRIVKQRIFFVPLAIMYTIFSKAPWLFPASWRSSMPRGRSQ